MKKLMTLALLMTIAVTANAMSYTMAKNEALFLSDKMAYELNLTDAQYDAVYEINLDYLMCINDAADVMGPWWNRRNMDLQYVLNAWQYKKYMDLTYFYRPLSWRRGNWVFNVYSHYNNRSHFFKGRPSVFVSYRGGNNRRAAHYYAERRVVNHAPTAAHRPGHGATWRDTGNHHPAPGGHHPGSGNHHGRFGSGR